MTSLKNSISLHAFLKKTHNLFFSDDQEQLRFFMLREPCLANLTLTAI